MNKQQAKLTFAILYGIGEGRLIGWRMRRALKKRGFIEAKAADADVIFTHSGGIYMFPPTVRAKTFVHLNVTTYIPARQLLSSHYQKLRYDLRRRRAKRQLVRWFLALMTNGLYLFNVPRGLHMRRGFMNSREVLQKLPAGKHIFICGFQDGLSDPQNLLKFTDQKHTYLTITAGHDDCWREPDTFIDAMQPFLAAESKA